MGVQPLRVSEGQLSPAQQAEDLARQAAALRDQIARTDRSSKAYDLLPDILKLRVRNCVCNARLQMCLYSA